MKFSHKTLILAAALIAVLVFILYAYAADNAALRVFGDGAESIKEFTISDLMEMDAYEGEFSLTNSFPASKVIHAKGVRLSSVFDAAGVKSGAEEVVFTSSGGESRKFLLSELTGCERYAYPNIEDGDTAQKISVPVILSYEVSGKRVDSGTLTLVMGQRAPYERTNEYILRDVVSIEIICSEPNVWSVPLTTISAGAVQAGTTVTLAAPESGACVYYTTDGSEPTLYSTVVDSSYLGWGRKCPCILIQDDTIIKAVTVGAGKKMSAVAVYPYIVCEERFLDLDNVDLQKGAIYALSKYGVINGVEDTVFAPNECVTRAQAAKMITLALGYDELDASPKSPFTDVSPDAWFAPYISKVSSLGVMSGFTDATFRPDEPISIEQLAAVLIRAAGEEADIHSDWVLTLNDVNASEWARAYVSYAVQKGHISETEEDSSFDFTSFATRAQAADMVYRALY